MRKKTAKPLKVVPIKSEEIESTDSSENEENFSQFEDEMLDEQLQLPVKTECSTKIKSWRTYPFYCFLCPYSSHKLTTLVSHAISKHKLAVESLSKMQYQCVDCNKICDTYCSFLNHVHNHHPILKLNCDICSECFQDYQQLATHHLKHKETIDHTFQPFVRYCNLCAKVYPTRVALNKHILTHDRALQCQVCEKSFKCLKYLKRHMAQHNGLDNYKCQYCEKTFVRRFNKICHERTHNGERPYKCDKCSKRFSFSSTWKSHMRIHTGELPYKCESCDAAFRHFDSLKEHKRTHTKEKPYKCLVCDIDFSFRRSLNRHMQAVHTSYQQAEVETKSLPLKKRPTRNLNMKTEQTN